MSTLGVALKQLKQIPHHAWLTGKQTAVMQVKNKGERTLLNLLRDR